jgi:hypothetical protein
MFAAVATSDARRLAEARAATEGHGQHWFASGLIRGPLRQKQGAQDPGGVDGESRRHDGRREMPLFLVDDVQRSRQVVPSMVAVNTNASSQNATWRGTAGAVLSAPSECSRQSTHGWSGMRRGACAFTMLSSSSRRDEPPPSPPAQQQSYR